MTYKNYRIDGKDGDWTLHHYKELVNPKTKESRMGWVVVGYWCNLEHVLEKIMRLEGSEADDLKGYVERMEACYQGLRDYFAGEKSANEKN